MVDFNADWERLDDLIRWGPTHRHRRRLILGLCRNIRFQSVLDVGCGNGELAIAIQETFGAAVTGFDRSEAVIRSNGDRRPGVRFIQGDIQARPPQGTYDLVLCSELLEHLESDLGALANIRAVCRGHLIVAVPGGVIRQTDRQFGHLRHYNIRALASLLDRSGFESVRCFAWGFPFVNLYKRAINAAPHRLMQAFCGGDYGLSKKMVSLAVYGLFFATARLRWGEQIIAVARAPMGRKLRTRERRRSLS